jgi:Fic family protein
MNTIYRLRKPKISSDDVEKSFKLLTERSTELFDFFRKTSDAEYLYWDDFLYKEPSPKGISKESLWAVTKLMRKAQALPTPIRDTNGNFFTWSKLPYFEEFFHDLDMNTGGGLFVRSAEIDKANKQKLISRGIMEEAIASSQLEGAATSRQAAKKMLREGRKPKNSSEQMIVNSYFSMKSIEERYKDERMTFDLLLEMHGMITRDTLDSESERPRLRQEGDPIVVSDDMDGTVYHEGPDIGFVKVELGRLIRFANDELETERFIHPMIKAIMLHFWIGYLHPFTDGNGRLARLLFYWYLIRNGYWAFAYLPISKVIKRTPKQYIMAYVYSEQDDNDLSYFINYNIRKVKLAMREFLEYVKKQSEQNVSMRKKYGMHYHLNDRQVHLLQYLHGDPDASTTLITHVNVNQVSRVTASKDLKDLVQKGFLVPTKRGRNVYYSGTEKIGKLFP